jgi:hypothetical protein
LCHLFGAFLDRIDSRNHAAHGPDALFDLANRLRRSGEPFLGWSLNAIDDGGAGEEQRQHHDGSRKPARDAQALQTVNRGRQQQREE